MLASAAYILEFWGMMIALLGDDIYGPEFGELSLNSM